MRLIFRRSNLMTPRQRPSMNRGAPVIPFPGTRAVRPPSTPLRNPGPAGGDSARPARPAATDKEKGAGDLSDMEIPTFIRRQMD
mgnify:CR=1 FL=1